MSMNDFFEQCVKFNPKKIKELQKPMGQQALSDLPEHYTM